MRWAYTPADFDCDADYELLTDDGVYTGFTVQVQAGAPRATYYVNEYEGKGQSLSCIDRGSFSSLPAAKGRAIELYSQRTTP